MLRLIVPLTVATVLVLAQLAYALIGGVGLIAQNDPVAVAAIAEELLVLAAQANDVKGGAQRQERERARRGASRW